MKGIDNELYLTLLVISNAVAILQLIAAWKWPRISRVSFFLLFGWASWMNWTTALADPSAYLEYSNLTWSGWYRDFINGWFARHIVLSVGSIATAQGLIALSMLCRGWIFKAGAGGAILFLLAILPLGVGAGFPCTAIMAAALFVLAEHHSEEFLWQKNKIVTHKESQSSRRES